MSISAPVKSTQFTNATASPITFVKPSDWGAKVKASYCILTFTAAGYTTASAGDISLIKLPPGRIRLLVDLCRLVCPQGTSTSDLDIGWAAYRKDGAVVAADEDGLGASIDVGGGAIDAALTLPAVGSKVFDSDAGVDIVCSFDTANSPASGDLELILVYMTEN